MVFPAQSVNNQPVGSRVRVATWNLWSSPFRIEERLRAAAGFLDSVEVLLMQESTTVGSLTSASFLAEVSGFEFIAEASSGESRCAVLSRLPLRESSEVSLLEPSDVGPDLPSIPAVSALIDHPASGRSLRVVSAHLAWGSPSEGIRLRQAMRIAEHLDEMVGGPVSRVGDPVGVVGMDANTLPDAATLRFLRGLDPVDGRSTLFLDTWALAGSGEGFTSVPTNPHAYRTAQEVGILLPERLPSRRIDFLMVRGYAYGRPGMPITAEMLGASGEFPPSDHFGVAADLWMPRV